VTFPYFSPFLAATFQFHVWNFNIIFLFLRLLPKLQNSWVFTRRGCQPNVQSTAQWTWVSLSDILLKICLAWVAASIACEFAGACKLPHRTTCGFNKVKIPWSQCRDITKETKTNQHTEHGQ
jgi:hypothetical protein